MKLLATVTVVLLAAPVLTVAVVTLVVAACLTTAPTCHREASTPAATDGQYQPDAAPITAAALDVMGHAIGAPVPTYSVLRDPDAYGTGWGGPSVNMLAPAMKLAVARLEIAIGHRLQVNSGYRTTGYQAKLCPQLSGPCAPPGRSMHQRGLAVDVTNWAATIPHLDSVGLCQPCRQTTPATYPTPLVESAGSGHHQRV